MKKVLSIFLALLLLCSTGTLAFAADEPEIIAQGTCGAAVNWKLDSNGQMTIYGSGSMQNYWYTEDRRPPYETYKDQVTSLVIEEGVTAIGKYAFYNFKNLTEKLVFPNSLKSIWDCAFEGCNGLTEAPQFNNTLTDIGFAAFRSCKNMKGDLVIPDSVTNLGIQAFSTCSSLDGTLYIGKNVQRLYGGVFYDCSKLTGNLLISDSVQSIDGSAFYSCRGFDGSLYIGHSVTKIEPLAFAYCGNLTGDLTIPDSVTEIGSGAFYGCRGLNGELHLGNHLERLYEENYQYGAFQGCSNLKGDLVLPESLTYIGRQSFYDCRSLSGTLQIPEGVTYIGNEAFHACAANTDLKQFFSNYPEQLTIEERITEPTCRVAGNKYCTAKCAQCGLLLKTWNESLPAAHNLTDVPYVAATEEADGNIAHFICTSCSALFKDEEAKEPATKEDVTLHFADEPKIENSKPETGDHPASFELVTYCKHDGNELYRKTVTLEMHPAKEATLEEGGNIKYYTDDDGNKYVYNEESKTFEEADEVATPSLLVKETELVVGSSQIWIPMYNKFQITAYVLPENATFKEVTFTVEDPSILSVDADGNLTPLSLGETNVIVSSHHGLTKTIPVVVQHGHVAGEPQYEDVTIEPTCVTPGRGMQIVRCNECGAFMSSTGPVEIPPTGIHLTKSVAAREATEEADGNIAHYVCSSCSGLFKDEEAKQMTTKEEVTLHFADEPKIENSKLESEDQPASYELVTYCKHDGTELYRKTVTLEMHPAVEASLLGDGNVKYYTDEEGNKYVFDDKTGTFKPTDDIEVPFVPIAVEKLNLNETEVTLLIGETFQLEPTVEPADATFPQVIFTSSDEAVAEVNPLGLITAKAEGTATIECVTADGATATVTVTIQHCHNPGEPKIEDITKEATCCESGVGDLVTRCAICGEELEREKDVTMPATGKHTPGEGQKTQEIKGTCEAKGGYVLVVKCADCGEVLSSETITTGYGDHDWNDGEVKSGKYDKYTVTDYTCQHCGQHKTEQTRNPNYQFRCKRCDWYDARRNNPGIRGFVYRMIHDITHMVQRINFLT